MDISWSTVFSSVGASVGACGILVWLCREWISARLKASIQHEYDIKLEEHKTFIQHDCDIRLERYRVEFNQKLSDHQTRFNLFHQEKAKAIKVVFSYAVKLYYHLNMLRELEANPIWNINQTKKEQEKEKLKNEIIALMDKAAQEWMNYRLFLTETEDVIFAQYQARFNTAFDVSFKSTEKQISKEKIQEMDSLLLELETIINNLKASFQSTLQGKEYAK